MPWMWYGPARWVGWIVLGCTSLLYSLLIFAFPTTFSVPNPVCGSGLFWGAVGIVAVTAGLWVGRVSHWKVRAPDDSDTR